MAYDIGVIFQLTALKQQRAAAPLMVRPGSREPRPLFILLYEKILKNKWLLILTCQSTDEKSSFNDFHF